MYRKLAQQTNRSKPVTTKLIFNMRVKGNPQFALEDHSMTKEIKAEGTFVG
jgi:hypothetical protein